MNWKLLDEKIIRYAAQIQKISNFSLLAEVKKAQQEAKIAAEKAHSLYRKFIQSSKKD
jgi:hypothetical protein